MSNLSLELDLLAAKLDAKGQGVACGGGWISPRAKCSKDKAKTTSKENLAKTTERRKKMHGLKAEVAADKGKKAKDKPPESPPASKNRVLSESESQAARSKSQQNRGLEKSLSDSIIKTFNDPEIGVDRRYHRDMYTGKVGKLTLPDGQVVDASFYYSGKKNSEFSAAAVNKEGAAFEVTPKYQNGKYKRTNIRPMKLGETINLKNHIKESRDAAQKKEPPSDDASKSLKDKPSLKVLPGGEKSLKDLFAEADRIGSKYQEPGEPASISAKRAANRILKESGYDQVSDIASGKVRRIPDRSKAPLKARERPTSVRGVSIDSLRFDLELLKYSHI